MIAGNTSASAALTRLRAASAHVRRGSTAMSLVRVISHQVQARARPMITPGTIPARKRREIETPPATPKTMKPIEGGITGAMIPPAAIRPAERPTS